MKSIKLQSTKSPLLGSIIAASAFLLIFVAAAPDAHAEVHFSATSGYSMMTLETSSHGPGGPTGGSWGVMHGAGFALRLGSELDEHHLIAASIDGVYVPFDTSFPTGQVAVAGLYRYRTAIDGPWDFYAQGSLGPYFSSLPMGGGALGFTIGVVALAGAGVRYDVDPFALLVGVDAGSSIVLLAQTKAIPTARLVVGFEI